jgi:hypothetical protein
MQWLIHVAGKYGREGHDHSRFYLHDPVFEMPGSERYYQHTFMLALVAAIRGLATTDPAAFLVAVGQMAGSDSMVVHQLIAEGLAALGKARPQDVLAYILGDDRRLALGSRYDDKHSRAMITAVAPFLDPADARRLEEKILAYAPYLQDSSLDVQSRRQRYRWNREHRITLLRAFPPRLSFSGWSSLPGEGKQVFSKYALG